jgi:hypothetical protein
MDFLPKSPFAPMAGLLLLAAAFVQPALAAEGLRIATFETDATPPIGYEMGYSVVKSIGTPLLAKGVVITGAGKPIVMLAVDWGGVDGRARDEWHALLAQAAGTTPDRVTVHHLHQHDAPGASFHIYDERAKQGLPERIPAGLPDKRHMGARGDGKFGRRADQGAAQRQAGHPSGPGQGQCRTDRVEPAPDGRQRARGDAPPVDLYQRLSGGSRRACSRSTPMRTGISLSIFHPEEAQEAPEGLIDPAVRVISFWNGNRALASLTYYASHPQVSFGKGIVTPDFVGLARERHQKETGVFQVHFNGAGGNITLGKYNDGSDRAREEFTVRFLDAMRRAWKATERSALTPADVEWRTTDISLPAKYGAFKDEARAVAADTKRPAGERVAAINKYARAQALEDGTTLSALRVGNAYSVHIPGRSLHRIPARRAGDPPGQIRRRGGLCRRLRLYRHRKVLWRGRL